MTLLRTVRAALAKAADPARAEQMRAYMKSEMPYAGVAMPIAKAIFQEAFATYPDGTLSKKPFTDEARLLADVTALWDGAKVREERYAALALFTHPRAKKLRSPAFVPVLRHLVLTGAWWDLVDWAAPHTLGPLLGTHREATTKVVLAWAKEQNVWIRRSAILSQLHRKATIDTSLLAETLAPSLGDKTFFVAKAVGWALRETSKTFPDFVRGYLAEHGPRMAPLSVREGKKHLDRGRS